MAPDRFSYQPDPAKPYYVQRKAERLVRRGPREYYLVARTPDGSRMEARFAARQASGAGLVAT